MEQCWLCQNNEQKEITYDKREEQLKIIVRWIGDKSCLI